MFRLFNKITLTGISFLLLISSCREKGDEKFVVQGTLKNTPGGTIYLEEAALGSMQPVVIDSAKIASDGRFKLSPLAKEESLFILRLNSNPTPVASFINDSKNIDIAIDAANEQQPYQVKGSPASKTLQDYLFNSNEQLTILYNLIRQADTLSGGGKDSLAKALNLQKRTATDNYKNYTTRIIDNSKSAPLSVFILGSYQSYSSNPALGLEPLTQAEAVGYINKMAARFPAHKGLSLLKSGMKQETETNAPPASPLLNKPAPDFTLPDVAGTPVTLSSLKGKYVLVDFWASWCAPCRAENPNVVKAYQQFNNKNFTILGVSLDQKKEAWTKAIQEDGLTWTHVSDLKFWSSIVVPIYDIQGIPYNVLLDPNGVVVAENLREGELISKLSEVLK